MTAVDWASLDATLSQIIGFGFWLSVLYFIYKMTRE